jgi:hypothetical protein
MALTNIQKVRVAVADLDPAFPILDDTTYEYFLEKNNDSIDRAALDAAKTILFTLSQRTNQTVDLFSVSGGSKSAEQYRLALQLFLRDPQLNPVYNNVGGYAGGVSISDMQSNINDLDNNIVQSPINPSIVTTTLSTDYFSV